MASRGFPLALATTGRNTEPHDDEEAPLKKKEVATDGPAPDAFESEPEAKEIAAVAGDAELLRLEGEIDGSGIGHVDFVTGLCSMMGILIRC